MNWNEDNLNDEIIKITYNCKNHNSMDVTTTKFYIYEQLISHLQVIPFGYSTLNM